jgi:hypothetical protein
MTTEGFVKVWYSGSILTRGVAASVTSVHFGRVKREWRRNKKKVRDCYLKYWVKRQLYDNSHNSQVERASLD